MLLLCWYGSHLGSLGLCAIGRSRLRPFAQNGLKLGVYFSRQNACCNRLG